MVDALAIVVSNIADINKGTCTSNIIHLVGYANLLAPTHLRLLLTEFRSVVVSVSVDQQRMVHTARTLGYRPLLPDIKPTKSQISKALGEALALTGPCSMKGFCQFIDDPSDVTFKQLQTKAKNVIECVTYQPAVVNWMNTNPESMYAGATELFNITVDEDLAGLPYIRQWLGSIGIFRFVWCTQDVAKQISDCTHYVYPQETKSDTPFVLIASAYTLDAIRSCRKPQTSAFPGVHNRSQKEAPGFKQSGLLSYIASTQPNKEPIAESKKTKPKKGTVTDDDKLKQSVLVTNKPRDAGPDKLYRESAVFGGGRIGLPNLRLPPPITERFEVGVNRSA